MLVAMLIAFAVSAPQDWGAMIPRPAPTGKTIIGVLRQITPPPGKPPAPLALRLTVVPPAPAAPYVVVVTYRPDPNGLDGGWIGDIPIGAVSPSPLGGRYIVRPYEWGYMTRIRCVPPLGNADFGGGDIAHNAGPIYSAGPAPAYVFLGQSPVTAGYTFTVSP